MTIKPFINAAIIVSLSLSGAVMAAAGPGPKYRGGNSTVDKAPTTQTNQTTQTALTSDETIDLQFMREEEKLARDVYLTLDRQWGDKTRVFARIAESEEKHTSTVGFLLAKFGVEDPVVNDTIGVFTHPEIQALYDELVEKGSHSITDALHVGALIEEVDMRDILAAMSRTDERAITVAYSNLLDGSKSHLRAFVRVIETYGITYEAQVLDAEEVELILTDDGRVKE